MSRFYASIVGNRGEATRMGTPNSGISGHIRGWNVGVCVDGDDESGEDIFYISATAGSNGGHVATLGSVKLVDGIPTFTPA